VIWLDRRDVEAFHVMLMAEFGGLSGLRDAGALESALARPRNLLAYGTPSASDLAAAYAFGIARNHPFVDGNKRAALVTAFTFLELNGYDVKASEAEAVLVFLDLAAGRTSQKELAKWLESGSVARQAKRKQARKTPRR
jgi:death on curing protein